MREIRRIPLFGSYEPKPQPITVDGEVIRVEQPTTALAVIPKVQQVQQLQEPPHDYEKQESILGKLIW